MEDVFAAGAASCALASTALRKKIPIASERIIERVVWYLQASIQSCHPERSERPAAPGVKHQAGPSLRSG
jgi:hypothetical protein